MANDAGKGHHTGNSTASMLNRERILDEACIQPGDTVVDAGCGSGYMAKAFSELVQPQGTVYALDQSHEAVAALVAETGNTNIVPLEADITRKTSIEAHTVDLIYLSTVFHIFSQEQIAGFQQEAERLLKLGGRLAIIEIQKGDTPFGPPQNMRYSPEELKNTLNFTPLSCIEAGHYFYMQLFRYQ